MVDVIGFMHAFLHWRTTTMHVNTVQLNYAWVDEIPATGLIKNGLSFPFTSECPPLSSDDTGVKEPSKTSRDMNDEDPDPCELVSGFLRLIGGVGLGVGGRCNFDFFDFDTGVLVGVVKSLESGRFRFFGVESGAMLAGVGGIEVSLALLRGVDFGVWSSAVKTGFST